MRITKIIVTALIAVIALFPSCTPPNQEPGGGGIEAEANEIASAVGSAIDAFSAVSKSLPGGDTVSANSLPSLKSFQPNDTFASVYEEFVKTEGVMDGILGHFFDLGEQGMPTAQKTEEDWTDDTHPEFGNVTFSLNGWTFNDEPGGGTTIDKISVKFVSGEDTLSVTVSDMTVSQIDDAVTIRTSMAYEDSREYADGDWVSFSSEMTMGDNITYGISNLRYKGQSVSEEDTAKVESILMGENPGTEPEPGIDPENELAAFTEALLNAIAQAEENPSSLTRSFNLNIDVEANAEQQTPKMKTESPIVIEFEPTTEKYTFNGNLDLYSTTEGTSVRMATIKFTEFEVVPSDGAYQTNDGFAIEWVDGYASEANVSSYTKETVTPFCVMFAQSALNNQPISGVTKSENNTDTAIVEFANLDVEGYSITASRLEAVKVFDDSGNYAEGSMLKITVTVDGEEYLAGAYMSSGSSSASIQSAAASGFGGTELIINEDGILDQMLDVYQTYSGLVASAVDSISNA